MPVNKLALLRYKTIDTCLQNRFRKWSLEDLMEAVSEALYEYEGITSGVSRRTIQLDIQNMRSDKLGYQAPIVVKDRKFYTYSDNAYSITRSPLSGYDLGKLNEVVITLRQFKGFGFFEDMNALITRLEDKLIQQKHPKVHSIHFDTNEQVKGQEYLSPIHKAILSQNPLLIRYQSFKAQAPTDKLCFPYLLKEYNNRWFVLAGLGSGRSVNVLALDRIIALKAEPFEPFQEPEGIDISTYFDELIGVSKTSRQRPRKIVFRMQTSQLPYFLTKPMHPSQQVLREEGEWAYMSLYVIWNYELEREIIGLGEYVEVISPRRLRRNIIKRLHKSLDLYETESSTQ